MKPHRQEPILTLKLFARKHVAGRASGEHPIKDHFFNRLKRQDNRPMITDAVAIARAYDRGRTVVRPRGLEHFSGASGRARAARCPRVTPTPKKTICSCQGKAAGADGEASRRRSKSGGQYFLRRRCKFLDVSVVAPLALHCASGSTGG